MNWKLDSKGTRSWLERVRPKEAVSFAARAETSSAVGPQSPDARQGWDPFDVWLRHIHEPRRRRDAAQR
jgi:hypothetical protein